MDNFTTRVYNRFEHNIKGGVVMTKYNKWSQEELDLLVKLREVDKLTYEQIAKRMEGRTRQQVNTKYNYIKAKRDSQPRKRTNRKWTETEIEILKQNYLKDYEEIMELLPSRSRLSIIGKIAHLGLSRPNNALLSEEDKQFIRDNYLDMSQAELSKHLNVDRGVIRRFKENENLNTQYIWDVVKFEPDEDDFMSINIKLERKQVEVGEIDE